MKTFPSSNEKVITSIIFSFFIGVVLGVFFSNPVFNINIFLPAFATLIAAFIGAWAAYKLEDNKKKREYKELCIENGNRILFALYERIKALRLVQAQSINPLRDYPFNMISMKPLLNFSYPESEFNIENLMFILGTKHKQLILDLQTERECFKVAFNLVKFRSELHFHHVQPAMESGGIQEGKEYTRQELIDVLGERIFAQLEQATNDLIENIDKTIDSGEMIKSQLVNSLKELFPNETILNYKFENK